MKAPPNNVRLLQPSGPKVKAPVPRMGQTPVQPKGFYNEMGKVVARDSPQNFKMLLEGKPDRKLLEPDASTRVRIPAPLMASRKDIERRALTDTDWKDKYTENSIKSALSPEAYLNLIENIVKMVKDNPTESQWWKSIQRALQALNAKRLVYVKQGREFPDIDTNRETELHDQVDAKLINSPTLGMPNTPRPPSTPAPGKGRRSRTPAMVPIPVPSLSKVKKEPQDEQKEEPLDELFKLLQRETHFKDYLAKNKRASGPQVVAWLKRNDKKSYQQLPDSYKKPNARVTKKQVKDAVNGF